MAAITSGVFFQGRPPATGAAHAFALDLLGEQLLAYTVSEGDAGTAATVQRGVRRALSTIADCGHEVGIDIDQ